MADNIVDFEKYKAQREQNNPATTINKPTSVDRMTDENQEKIAKQVAKAGFDTTVVGIAPEPTHLLTGLKNAVDTSIEVIGSDRPEFGKWVGGEGPNTNVGTAKGKNPLRFLREKVGKLRFQRNKQDKQAA